MVRKAAKDLVSKSFQLQKCWKPLYQALNRDRTAARLAQLGERRSAEREAVVSNPGGTNTQGLKITEEKVLPL